MNSSPDMSMKRCERCGKLSPVTAAFCARCGKELRPPPASRVQAEPLEPGWEVLPTQPVWPEPTRADRAYRAEVAPVFPAPRLPRIASAPLLRRPARPKGSNRSWMWMIAVGIGMRAIIAGMHAADDRRPSPPPKFPRSVAPPPVKPVPPAAPSIPEAAAPASPTAASPQH